MVQQPSFTKKDIVYSAILGALIGALTPFILTNLHLRFSFQNYLFLIFAVMAPLGLYIFHLLSTKFSALFQVGKFGIVGSSNFFIDLGVFNLLIYLSGSVTARSLFAVSTIAITSWSIFKAVSFLVASVNSYFWNKFWTFEHGKTEKVGREYAQFLMITIAGFIVNVSVFSIVFALKPAGITESVWGTVGVMAGTVSGLAVNFIGYKFFVFRDLASAR